MPSQWFLRSLVGCKVEIARSVDGSIERLVQ